MGVKGRMKCVKFLLFFFSLIFWLCGLALIVLGVLAQQALHQTLMIKDGPASGAPLVLIVGGVVIFLIAFFGCCGAWKENYYMAIMFAILVFLVILCEIAAIIAGHIFRNKVHDDIQDSLTNIINNYKNSSDEFKDTVDKLQKDLKCCGVKSSSDWRDFKSDGTSVPDSCCVTVASDCGVGAMTDAARVHQEGCYEASLKKYILWVIIPAIVIAVLQVLGIVFACLLMRGIRSGQEVVIHPE